MTIKCKCFKNIFFCFGVLISVLDNRWKKLILASERIYQQSCKALLINFLNRVSIFVNYFEKLNKSLHTFFLLIYICSHKYVVPDNFSSFLCSHFIQFPFDFGLSSPPKCIFFSLSISFYKRSQPVFSWLSIDNSCHIPSDVTRQA